MKKVIIKLLSYVGYGLVKIQGRQIRKRNSVVQIGKYSLEIPYNNPLSYTYKMAPEFSSEITRIVVAVKKKYHNLHAIDIGANVGDTFLRMKNADEQLPVICIEGDAFSFSYLKKNSTGHKGATLIQSFLGDSDSELNVTFEKKEWNTTLVPDKNSSETVKLITLDNLLAKQGIDQSLIKFVKLDTEGFDTVILRGAGTLLKNSRPVLYMEYNNDNMAAIGENGLSEIFRLKDVGYTKILFFDDIGKYISVFDIQDVEGVRSMDAYIRGKNRLVAYYNLCVIASEDHDVARSIIETEVKYNKG